MKVNKEHFGILFYVLLSVLNLLHSPKSVIHRQDYKDTVFLKELFGKSILG